MNRPRWLQRWLGCAAAMQPAARSTAAVIRDAARSANAAHGYPLALREADAIAAAALRRALRHGA